MAFRIQNQRLLITYSSHLDKTLYKEWFASNFPLKTIHMAHEAGLADQEFPYLHTHVLVDFGRNFQSTNCRIFDYTPPSVDNSTAPIHPHIKKVLSLHHWTRSCNYLAKEDPDNENLRVKETWADGVWAEETVQDALRKYGNAKSATSVIRTFDLKRTRDYKPAQDIENYEFSFWTKELHDELFAKIVDRSIIWYWDQLGNSGKSEFARFMMACYPEKVLLLTQLGGQYHTGTIILNAITNGWEGDTVFVDLARDFEFKDIYSPIEALKNGIITALKYQGGTQVFNRCKIVVFSNFLPNIDKASYDRWDIRELMTTSKPKVIPRITRIPMSMIVKLSDPSALRPETLQTVVFPERPLTLNILK